MEVYMVMVYWKDGTSPQPFAFDNIDKMFDFRNQVMEKCNIKEVNCYMLTVR